MLVDCKVRINFLRHKITVIGAGFADLFPQLMGLWLQPASPGEVFDG